jgi:membrane protease YdiL (CAAX protease family)
MGFLMALPRTIPLAVALGTAMYLPAVGFRSLLSDHFGVDPGHEISVPVRLASYGLLAGTAMLAICIGAARDGWRPFGFCRPVRGWGRFAAAAVLTGIVSSLAIKLGHGSGLDSAMGGIGAGATVALLVVATLVEELFVRGWMLGFLEPIAGVELHFAGISASARVLTGAVFFAAMHLTLAKTSIDLTTFAIILGFTMLLGVLCGIAREKSGSLLAAIATHIAGNVGGVVGGILYVLVTGVPIGAT